MSLAAAMAAVCPGHEVDELTVSLLNIFEKRGLSFVLIEKLIKQEIEDTGMTTCFSNVLRSLVHDADLSLLL
jgi:hypothetical protein